MKVKVKLLSHVQLSVTPWTAACQAPLSMGFSKQEYWSGLPFPSPGDLPDPGIEPGSSSLQADSLPSEPPEKEGGNKFSSDFLSVRRFTHINTLTLMTLPGTAWVHLTFQVGVWAMGVLPYPEIRPVKMQEQTQNCDPPWTGRIF